MRTWVYNKVKNMNTIPAGFLAEGKVISSGAADSPEPPFLVVNLNVEQPFPGMPHRIGLQDIPFTIWAHDAPGSMLNIDAACIALKNGIPAEDSFMIGSMSVFQVRWTEIGEDSYDDHFKTNCRPVRFAMVTRR